MAKGTAGWANLAGISDYCRKYVCAVALVFRTGLSFLTAAVLAILRGHVFTHPLRMVLVAIAVVIGSLVIPSLGGDAWNALRRGDTITAACLVGFVILFWLFKKQLETGRMRGVKVAAPMRKRKSRRR